MFKRHVWLRLGLASVACGSLLLLGQWLHPPARWGGAGTAPEPIDLPLLWIEEINSHLLPPGAEAARAGAGPAPHPVGAGGDPALDERGRVVRLPAGDLPRAGSEPRLLVRYGVYDHDRLLAESFTAVTAARLPYELAPPQVGGDRSARLLPGPVRVTGVAAGDAVELEIAAERLVLAAGQAWAAARVASGSAVLTVAPDTWTRELAAALDANRPLTVLRLLHRGRWRLEPLAGEPR